MYQYFSHPLDYYRNFCYYYNKYRINNSGEMSMMDIVVRAVRSQDAPALLKIYAPYVKNTAVSFEYEIPSEEEFIKRIENTLLGYPYIAAVSEGEIIGYAYTGTFHSREAYSRSAETSIYIRSDKTGHGIGKLLYGVLESISKAQNITNLNACIACPEADDEYLTHNSIYFHEHMGYTPTGITHKCGYKFGRWYNILWMEKFIAEHTADAPPFIPFPLLGKDFLGRLGL